MDVQIERLPDGLAVRTAGELDASTSDEFRQVVVGSLRSEDRRVELDAEALTFLDSSGTTALVDLHETLVGRGGGLHISAASHAVTRVLEITALARPFGLS